MDEATAEQRSKRRAALLSVFSNTALVAGKLAAGLLTGSVAVLSEAVHSGMDLLAAVIAFAAVIVAGRPPDDDHPHGHGKFEDLSGVVEALLIFGAVVYIGFESVSKLLYGGRVEQLHWGMVAMGVSAAVNTAVSWHLQRVGRRTDSIALLADAAHLRTDVYSSLGVMAGLAAVHFTGLTWFDPLAAMAVGLLIVHEAWCITRRALADLLDQSIPTAERERVEAVLSEAGLPYHNLRSRRAGPVRKIDLHLEVDPQMTVAQAHDICRLLEARIEQALPHAQVLIHTDPAGVRQARGAAGRPAQDQRERP